jgi:protein involved in polysaccharide export with SLBB domain
MKTGTYQIKKDVRKLDKSGATEVFRLIVLLFFSTGICPFLYAQNVPETSNRKADGNYRIGVGDVLQVIVVKQALLSLDSVRVGNEGTIRLPMLDREVRAACLSETELSAEITNKYKKYLLDPQVYVAVKEFNANPVALVGAVIAPGRFQLQRPMRLLELLTRVNGPAPNAGQTIQIIRNTEVNRCAEKTSEIAVDSPANESAQELISIPLAEVLRGDENFNPFVQAGDIISIAEAKLEQAFVVGNVRAAVTINLKEPVTLSKAIALAGGTAPGAQIDKIKISRQMPNSLAKTEFVVNLKDADKRRQDDILLQPNDIVDVPGPSGTRKFLKDIFRTVVPVITRVPIVIP